MKSNKGQAPIVVMVDKSLKDRLLKLCKKRKKELGRAVTIKEIIVTDLNETLKKFGV